MQTININLTDDFSKYLLSKLTTNGYLLPNNKIDIILYYCSLILRIPDNKCRKILISKTFSCPQEYSEVFSIIITKIENGENLIPYLSRKIKSIKYNDLLLNDWGIYHFHLGNLLEEDGFVNRTKDLLYVFFKESNAYIISIKKHESFSDYELIEILYNNWPCLFNNLELPLLFGPINNQTYCYQKELRKKCVNQILEINGKRFLQPGMGSAISGLSITALRQSKEWHYKLKQWEELIIAFSKDDKEIKKYHELNYELKVENNDVFYAVEEKCCIKLELGKLV